MGTHKKVEIMGNKELRLEDKYIIYRENKIFNLFFQTELIF